MIFGVSGTGNYPSNPVKMIENSKPSNERILKNALEIIHLVTGDEYVVVKKTLQSKCFDLLTSEIPFKHEDIAGFFSLEEWEYIKKHNLSQDDIPGKYCSISPPRNGLDILKGLPISFLRKFTAWEEDGADSQLGSSPSVSAEQDVQKLVEQDLETQKIGEESSAGHCLPEDCFPLKNILENSHTDPSSSGQVEEVDAAKFHGYEDESDTLTWLSSRPREFHTRDMRFVLSPLWAIERDFPSTGPLREPNGVPQPASSSSDQTVEREACRYSEFNRDSNSLTHSLDQTDDDDDDDDQLLDGFREDRYLASCVWDTPVEYDTGAHQESQGKSSDTASLEGESTESCSSHEPQDYYEETIPEGPQPSATSTYNPSQPQTSIPGRTVSNDCQDYDIKKVAIDNNSNPEKWFQQARDPNRKPSFDCGVCGKQYAYGCQLLVHQRTHTGEKPFECSDCGKHFMYKSGLHRHQVVHNSEPGSRCKVCGKYFIYQTSLIRHHRTHTSEKSLACSECGKQFVSNVNLIIHQRKHAGQKPEESKDCGECAAQKSA